MITVNPSTRQFTIPGADLVFGVESDSGSVVKEFQCPRYVGNNLDLAGSFIRINYRNANGEIDSYLVKEVTVKGDNIVFGWELTPKTTAYKGNITFVMCVVGPDTKVKWHTTLGRGQVLEGLEPDSGMIEAGIADVVAALIALVETQAEAVKAEGSAQIEAVQNASDMAEANAVAEIEAKRVNSLNSIPSDYTSLGNNVDGLIRSKAPGIVCDAEGSAIAIKDASNNYVQGLRIFGRSTQDGIPTLDAPIEIVSVESPTMTIFAKNLLKNTPAVQTINGVTFTINNDGSVTANGTSTSIAAFLAGTCEFKKGYTYIVSGCVGGGENTYRVDLRVERNTIFGNNLYDFGNGFEFTAEQDMTLYLAIRLVNGVTANNLKFYPMVRISAIKDNTYEQYVASQTIATTLVLHGLLVTDGGNYTYTDSNGQPWISDEVDLERGVYIQRILRRVFDGTETFDIVSTEEGGLRVVTDWHNVAYPNSAALCTHLRYKREIPGMTQGGNSRPSYYIPFASVKDWTDFLAEQYANGTPMIALVPSNTSIETPLSEAEIATYRTLHTNKPSTTIINDSGAHMSVKYTADTKLYIDNKIAAIGGN